MKNIVMQAQIDALINNSEIQTETLFGKHDSNGQARLVRGARYLLVKQDKNNI